MRGMTSRPPVSGTRRSVHPGECVRAPPPTTRSGCDSGGLARLLAPRRHGRGPLMALAGLALAAGLLSGGAWIGRDRAQRRTGREAALAAGGEDGHRWDVSALTPWLG
jgi:hypothetical protein